VVRLWVWPRDFPVVSSKDNSSESRSHSPLPDHDPTKSTFLAIAVLSSFVAVLFHELLFGKLLFWLDTHLTFEPLFGQLGDSLSTGRLLWNSLLETGKPILANPTQAALYPLNLLFAVLPASRAISILTLIHVLAGSIGTFVLAKRLELRNDSALVSGLLFAGAGTTLSVTPYIGLAWCTMWLPWLLVFCDRIARREHTLRSVVLLSLIVFMMLTIAEPMILIAASLGVFFWLVDGCFRRESTWAELLRNNLLLPGLAAATAVVALSPYLIAIALNLPNSVRALGFTWEGITIWSLHPLRLFECLAPGVFGGLGKPEGGAFWAFAMVPTKGFPYFPSLYFGAPVLALLVAGIRKNTLRRTSLAMWLTVLILLALGRWGPLYPWLEGFPGFDSARYPVKWLIPAIVPLSLLAGMGMRNSLVQRDDRSRHAFLFVLCFCVLTLAAIATAVQFPWFTQPLEIIAMGDHGSFSPDNRDVVVIACIRGLIPTLAAIGLYALARRHRAQPQIATLALSLLIAADLVAANTRLVETTDVEFFEREPVALQTIRSDPEGFVRIRIDENSSDAFRWAAGNPTLQEISEFQREILAGYVAARFGFPSALTRDTEATGPARVYLLKVLGETAPPREQAMVYGSASITHLVTDRKIDHPVFHYLATTRTIAGTSVNIYRNSLAQPRVNMVPVVIPYSGDDGYRRVLQDSSRDLFARAALVDVEDLATAADGIRDLIPMSGQSPPDLVSTARITADQGHRLTIRAETNKPAVLVISDAFLPQWSAQVNGVDTPLLRVNYCFRGLWLDKGRHTVELSYNPWSR